MHVGGQFKQVGLTVSRSIQLFIQISRWNFSMRRHGALHAAPQINTCAILLRNQLIGADFTFMLFRDGAPFNGWCQLWH
jgi:hypothetical protein